MKKSNFVALILGTIGTVFFALGMCMALIEEWGMFRRGIVPAVVKDETLTAGLLPASGAPRAGWRTRRCTGGASHRRRAAGPAPSR